MRELLGGRLAHSDLTTLHSSSALRGLLGVRDFSTDRLLRAAKVSVHGAHGLEHRIALHSR